MEYTKLYIGSNNETGILEKDTIIIVLNTLGNTQGYTIIDTIGYWNGTSEPSCIIEIYGSYNLSIVDILKKELKQDSIMVVKDYKVVEFI